MPKTFRFDSFCAADTTVRPGEVFTVVAPFGMKPIGFEMCPYVWSVFGLVDTADAALVQRCFILLGEQDQDYEYEDKRQSYVVKANSRVTIGDGEALRFVCMVNGPKKSKRLRKSDPWTEGRRDVFALFEVVRDGAP
jgi:hypothetical protein